MIRSIANFANRNDDGRETAIAEDLVVCCCIALGYLLCLIVIIERRRLPIYSFFFLVAVMGNEGQTGGCGWWERTEVKTLLYFFWFVFEVIELIL